jgi:hypothetical protein
LKVALSTIEPTKPIKSLNAKKVMTVIMPMEKVLALDRHKNVVVLN